MSKVPVLSGSLLATGFPYADFELVGAYLQTLQDFMQKCHGLRRIGSAALDLAYVACGRFEAFFEYNLKPWDVAAGTLIVRQAGGICTTFQGKDDCVFGKEILAANSIHEEVIEILHRNFYANAPVH